ncbi:MAG: hypothetical protein EHM78_02360 [Myxococcaceae bacterium]|nr:MAG: hypothetical protein EHM78_02360 [Myxococcaceae bacterium]
MQKLERAAVLPPSEELIEQVMKNGAATRKRAIASLQSEAARNQVWINDTYQVQIRKTPQGLVHLNIRRRDGGPILRDWRDFQAIKNQLVGAECEAVELYPAESRKVDTSNKYHLFCVPDPRYRFNFGWQEREVNGPTGATTPGLAQRDGDAAGPAEPPVNWAVLRELEDAVQSHPPAAEPDEA